MASGTTVNLNSSKDDKHRKLNVTNLSANTTVSLKTETASRTVVRNGEVFAVPHAHRKTGYKANADLTRTDKTHWETSYKSSFKKPQVGSDKKQIVSYKDNAIRSRLPVKFEDEAKPFVRHCHPRNVSQLKFQDGSRSEGTHFRTTSQTTYIPQNLPVGFTNPGIVSEKTRWMHKRQSD